MQLALEQHAVQAELARIVREEEFDEPTRAAIVYAAASVFASPRVHRLDLTRLHPKR
jgi:hypothetical protein